MQSGGVSAVSRIPLHLQRGGASAIAGGIPWFGDPHPTSPQLPQQAAAVRPESTVQQPRPAVKPTAACACMDSLWTPPPLDSAVLVWMSPASLVPAQKHAGAPPPGRRQKRQAAVRTGPVQLDMLANLQVPASIISCCSSSSASINTASLAYQKDSNSAVDTSTGISKVNIGSPNQVVVATTTAGGGELCPLSAPAESVCSSLGPAGISGSLAMSAASSC